MQRFSAVFVHGTFFTCVSYRIEVFAEPSLIIASLVKLNPGRFHGFGPSSFTQLTSEAWGPVSALSEWGGFCLYFLFFLDSVFKRICGGSLIPALLTAHKRKYVSSLNFWKKRIFPDHSRGLDIAHWTWGLKFFVFFLKLNEKCSGRERCVGPSQPGVRNGLSSVVMRFSSAFLGHACPPGKGITWAGSLRALRDLLKILDLSFSIFLEETSDFLYLLFYRRGCRELWRDQFVSGHAAKHRSRQLLVHEQTAGWDPGERLCPFGMPCLGLPLGSLLLFCIRQHPPCHRPQHGSSPFIPSIFTSFISFTAFKRQWS